MIATVPRPMLIFKWGLKEIEAAVFTMVLLKQDVALLLLGSSLLVCYASTPGEKFTCIQCMPENLHWNISEVRKLTLEINSGGCLTNPVDISLLLGRLPGIESSISTILLTLIGAKTSESLAAWEVKRGQEKVAIPMSVSRTDIGNLRDELKSFLKANKIPYSEFAKLAKVSDMTLSTFLANSRDTRVDKVNQIRGALQSLESKV